MSSPDLTSIPAATGDGFIADLDHLPFDNRFTRELAADRVDTNRPRQVHNAAFSRVVPTSTAKPMTLAWSMELAEQLGLTEELCGSDDFADVFSGNRVPRGADPYAAAYGGHQFGHWAGQLGDGRAIALGEVVDRNGQHQTLQLKGAGPTPYSRSADGRAVLRSSVREFLCSEAMYHLGIPTTRALSLVATGDDVIRDMLYDGHPAPEPGAVVCRVAPSFTRFGTFELPASRSDTVLLEQLVRFTIENDFPHLVEGGGVTAAIAPWFDEVCDRTASLVVDWMRVGFVHGVLNTDNMSILGLTIDYGPYGWLEDFDPSWTPNTTDAAGRRYRYGAQPQIAQWNLMQLANALVLLTRDPTPLQESLERFGELYATRFTTMMAARLGWGTATPDDERMIADLFRTLQLVETDQLIFYRSLSTLPIAPTVDDETLLLHLRDAWYDPKQGTEDVNAEWLTWLRAWQHRSADAGLPDDARRATMDSLNPKYVLRNYLAQEAIDAAEHGDTGPLWQLLEVLRRPYEEQPGQERFAAKRPEWARHKVGCSMLSCSS